MGIYSLCMQCSGCAYYYSLDDDEGVCLLDVLKEPIKSDKPACDNSFRQKGCEDEVEREAIANMVRNYTLREQ